MTTIWTEDQAKLLQYCLQNIIKTVKNIPRYQSKKFFIATPFNKGYRSFDVVGDTLEEMIFKATEILKINNIDRVNLETGEGLPILSIHLERGPTVTINDIVTEKTICNILL
ncbi:MAG: hypothetical protein ACXAC8_09895 [Candidatus Hodarchaeales archaeon]|jgi:hypothetical protein